MNEETQAASSPAEVEDVFRGEHVSLAEFSHYRKEGELPERFKPTAESVPADTPEETAPEGDEPETEPASEPEETQEPKGSGAEKRIKQLLAKTKELERKLAEKDVKPESSTAPAAPQTAGQEPTEYDTNADGTPKYATYNEFTKALARWEIRQELAEQKREQEQQEAQKALQNKLDEARARYDDADDVIFPAAQAIATAKIPQVIKEVFDKSDLYVDLCYVVGQDPAELKKFIELANTNPRAAIGKVFEYERGIREELSKNDTPRDDKGKFTAPEPKKTAAPKPPSPVGGASSRAFDVSDESLSPVEWMRKRNSDLQKRNS